MIAYLLTGLLLAAAPSPAPEPTYEAFLGATKLKNQEWAHGSARREADNWLRLVPGYVARARDLARTEPDPARQKALLALADRYEQGAAAVRRIHEVERPAHEQRCEPRLAALRLAYADTTPGHAQAVAAAYPEARRCADGFGAIVEGLEDANRALRKVHREAFETRLLVEPPRP